MTPFTLAIHRGSHEIGGSCVELRHADQRLLIDMGTPLMDPNGAPFDGSRLDKKSPQAIVAEGILADIPGLYDHNHEDGTVLGVLLSHAHMDHYGLLGFIHQDVPVFAGAATHTLLNASGQFVDSTPQIRNPRTFKTGIPFEVGPFRVTPFLVDHSAFDAHAFLIEACGRRIFYSGDFREGGWKARTLETIKLACRRSVDALILEGTTIGSDGHRGYASEKQVAEAMSAAFRESVGKPILVCVAGQNIDRIISIVKAANSARRTLVLDFYQGTILLEIARHNPNLPHPMSSGKSGMRVWFTERTWRKWRKVHSGRRAAQSLMDARIFPEELASSLDRSVILVRPSMRQDLERIPKMRDGLLIYSLWEGYKERRDTREFLDELSLRGFHEKPIHASGHADEKALKKLAEILDPGVLMPIHTTSPEAYAALFGIPVNLSGSLKWE